ncbi:MAG: cell filamentation protein Fic [candidate division SR1 bacterium CG_4_9_14_3_um_filter_40_9]|nr:MAG: cell filamentation protein Fic [candidate division SR1 bacterium CG_4_9_14_3_um_filter_40_9]
MKKDNKLVPNNSVTEFLLYTTPNGKVKVEIFLHDENIWLTQKLIALLFDCSTDNVSLHLKNIFESNELQEKSVTEEFSVTARDGKKYKTKHYNLDAIISVGYRVNSTNATLFRIWATERLKEYIIKGFTMDDERLKTPNYTFGQDYFEEQLARIADIRSSERRFYQKITDIYAQCSVDYDKNSDEAQYFFATVQNKLHFAISGRTAAEIISDRVSSAKPNVGLTNWKNSPQGAIRKTDVVVAKNYLNKEEIEGLNNIVEQYLIFAESQAKRKQTMFMRDWESKLGEFLKLNDRDILGDLGKVSNAVAEALALGEYEKYRVEQDKNYISDFDKEVKKLLETKRKK